MRARPPSDYDLGEFGTIEALHWLPSVDGDQAALEVSALNYPAHVFARWPGLPRLRRTFVLSIGVDSIAVRHRLP